MAPTFLFIVLTIAISVEAVLGNNIIECENLNEDSCTYAVSSTGKRCVLEKRFIGSGYTCRASEIMADKLKDWVETEECIEACGVERKSLGISSDSLLDRAFVGSLCSDKCYRSCPNIVDLYFNLAAGEGVYLPKFCESKKTNYNGRRRDMLEFNSVGGEALSPGGTTIDESMILSFDDAPAQSPKASSPDGITIDESETFSANDASAPGPYAWSPEGSTVDASAALEADNAPAPGPYAWSPEGSTMGESAAFSADDASAPGPYAWSPEGSTMGESAAFSADDAPAPGPYAWSPEGSTMGESAAFSADDASAPGPYAWSPEGSTMGESAAFSGDDASAPGPYAWSPEGSTMDESAIIADSDASAPSPWGF